MKLENYWLVLFLGPHVSTVGYEPSPHFFSTPQRSVLSDDVGIISDVQCRWVRTLRKAKSLTPRSYKLRQWLMYNAAQLSRTDLHIWWVPTCPWNPFEINFEATSPLKNILGRVSGPSKLQKRWYYMITLHKTSSNESVQVWSMDPPLQTIRRYVSYASCQDTCQQTKIGTNEARQSYNSQRDAEVF